MENNHTNGQENLLDALAKKIKNVRVAMLTTSRADGTLHSRPMATQEVEADGSIWFFTYQSSEKADEITQDAQVNISYADPDNDTYVSVSGKAKVVKNKEKAKELWKPILKAWFPEGLEEPGLALLKIEIKEAEYWDNHQNKMVQLFRMAQSIITGDIYKDGEHKKMEF